VQLTSATDRFNRSHPKTPYLYPLPALPWVLQRLKPDRLKAYVRSIGMSTLNRAVQPSDVLGHAAT